MDSEIPGQDAMVLSGAFVSAPPVLGDAAVPDGGVVPPRIARLEAFGSEAAYRALGAELESAERAREEHAARERARERAARQHKWREEIQRGAQRRGDAGVPIDFAADSPSEAASAPSPAPASRAAAAPTAATPAAGAQTSITNNQEQGVEEGDIVKVRGNDLIILRRGRLYSVRVEGTRITPRSVISAAPPNVHPASWYDEMLVDGDTILVIGYGYERRATEVNRFALAQDGRITYRDTILLSSGDYYSSRNYASRVVNHQLVLYTPIPLFSGRYDATTRRYERVFTMPGWRTLEGEWQTSANWGEVYRPVRRMGYQAMLHTVHTCDLTGPSMRCHSRGAVGPAARSFYVSGEAVYLWVTSNATDPDPYARTHEDLYRVQDPSNVGSVVYRFPLGPGPVGAVIAAGSPTDQFSFRERESKLQVLVTAEGRGDGMWSGELSLGDMALYQIPLSYFSNQSPVATSDMVRRLPRPEQPYMMQNRFVGDYVLYGSGETWVRRRRAQPNGSHQLLAHHIGPAQTQSIALSSSVDRIEPMDRDAVIVGTHGSDLYFTALALDATAHTQGTFTRQNAAQGETRSHGFFYLPDGDRRGMLGLPLRSGGEPGYRQLSSGSAEVLFLRVNDLSFHGLGSLRAQPPAAGFNDQCVASCMDWYGNARPIFWQGRILALMGYELVEGSLRANSLQERARTNYYTALASQIPPR